MSFADRTEAATPRKRQQARERGEVAKSQELVGAVILFAGLLVMKTLAPHMAVALERFTADIITRAARGELVAADLPAVARSVMVTVGIIVGPVLATAGTLAVATNLAQVGMLVTFQPLQPKAERLSPVRGLKRIFSRNAAMELAKGSAKIGVVAYVAISHVRAHQVEIYQLVQKDPKQAVGVIALIALQMAVKMAAAFLVVAAIDYAFQRYQYERNLRMTKQEVKDDLKQSEGDPLMRSHIRQKQREMGRQRMMQDVADASVVVTNPTHYAVALRYQAGREAAPRCLAKGRGVIAQRIRELAERHDVPLVENPPLARSLYKLVKVGHEIPETLYQAVAEVLALVWRAAERMRARRRGGRA